MFTFPMTLLGGVSFNYKSTIFNGIDEHIEFSTPMDIVFVGQWSISTWVKLNALNADQAILAKWEPDGNQRTFLIRVETNNKLGVYISAAGTTLDKKYTSVAALSSGQWYHIAVTFTNNNLRVYLNGVELTTGAGTLTKDIDNIVNNCFNSTTTVKAAARAVNGGAGVMGYLSGNLDEISFYSAPISPATVSAIYNGGEPADLTGTADLAHWYRMGEGDSPTTVFDQVSNKDGTLFNMDATNYIGDVP